MVWTKVVVLRRNLLRRVADLVHHVCAFLFEDYQRDDYEPPALIALLSLPPSKDLCTRRNEICGAPSGAFAFVRSASDPLPHAHLHPGTNSHPVDRLDQHGRHDTDAKISLKLAVAEWRIAKNIAELDRCAKLPPHVQRPRQQPIAANQTPAAPVGSAGHCHPPCQTGYDDTVAMDEEGDDDWPALPDENGACTQPDDWLSGAVGTGDTKREGSLNGSSPAGKRACPSPDHDAALDIANTANHGHDAKDGKQSKGHACASPWSPSSERNGDRSTRMSKRARTEDLLATDQQDADLEMAIAISASLHDTPSSIAPSGARAQNSAVASKAGAPNSAGTSAAAAQHYDGTRASGAAAAASTLHRTTSAAFEEYKRIARERHARFRAQLHLQR
jgi:hypothetical protein